MKRPLAAIGLTYLTTSAVAVCFFPEVNFILSVTAVVLGIAACFILREKTTQIIVIMSSVCAAFFVIGCWQTYANDLTAELGDQTCLISGEICEIPCRQYGRWRYVISTDSVDIPGAKQTIRMLVTSRNSIEEAKEGDRITCTVNFIQNSTETGYNSTTSLRADGIQARAWCQPYSPCRITGHSSDLKYITLKLRRGITDGIRRAFPERASAMLCGMILGDTDYMDAQTVDNFRSTGISHLLAVSGLHMTLLTVSLEELLRRLKLKRKPSSVITLCFIFAFMTVTGFSPSVVRAGLMHGMAQFGKISTRQVDSLTSMSIAILIMCAVNPWSAADIGMQLSVCSTLALLLLGGRVDRALMNGSRKLLIRRNIFPQRRIIRRLGSFAIHSLANTLTAGTVILPLTAVHFGRISLISPVTNLLCVYVAAVFIILGIIASLIYCIPLIGWMISLPLRLAAVLLCAYLESVTAVIAKLPFASVNTHYSYTPYLFGFAILLTVSAVLMSRRMRNPFFSRRIRGFVLCELAILLFAAMLSYEIFGRGPEIIIFDVSGGGMCVCAKNRSHAVFAEAGGDRYDILEIRDTLRTKGVKKVDALAVSDDSKSRSGNIHRLLDLCSPDCLITDSRNRFKGGAQKIPFRSCADIGAVRLRIETFTDSQGCRWQRLVCGETSALICPEGGNCALIPGQWKSCDAAVVGKEISGVSALNTGAFIITSGGKYADSLRNRLRNTGCRHVYSTQAHGTVTLSVKNGRLRVRTSV